MTTRKITPVGNRVLFQPSEKSSNFAQSSLIIPEKFREEPTEGVITALGTGAWNKDRSRTEFEVKVGDRVLVSKYGGEELIDDLQQKVINADKVILVISEKFLQPCGGRCLVQPDNPSDKIGRFFIPETSQEETLTGIVLAIGSDGVDEDTLEKIPWLVKVGDHVAARKYYGTDIKINNQIYKVYKQNEIVGTVE